MNPFDRLLVFLLRRARGLDDYDRYRRYRQIHAIHPSFRFNGPGTVLSEVGRISLGEESYIGMNSLLLSKPGTEILVGKHTSISHFFVVYTRNADADQDFAVPKERWKRREGSVRIGDYCWIGFRVLVLQGVTVGDNVVVGAHSVVTRDLLANGIYGGVPARLIRMKSFAESTTKPPPLTEPRRGSTSGGQGT